MLAAAAADQMPAGGCAARTVGEALEQVPGPEAGRKQAIARHRPPLSLLAAAPGCTRSQRSFGPPWQWLRGLHHCSGGACAVLLGEVCLAGRLAACGRRGRSGIDTHSSRLTKACAAAGGPPRGACWRKSNAEWCLRCTHPCVARRPAISSSLESREYNRNVESSMLCCCPYTMDSFKATNKKELGCDVRLYKTTPAAQKTPGISGVVHAE